jgi:hypothetical protein
VNKIVLRHLGKTVAEIECRMEIFGNIDQREFIRLMVEAPIEIVAEAGNIDDYINSSQFAALVVQKIKQKK